MDIGSLENVVDHAGKVVVLVGASAVASLVFAYAFSNALYYGARFLPTGEKKQLEQSFASQPKIIIYEGNLKKTNIKLDLPKI